MRAPTRSEIDHINAVSLAGALVAADEQKRQRVEAQRGQAELANLLLWPGAMEEHARARIRAGTPIVSDEDVPGAIAWAPAGTHRVLHKGRYVDDVFDPETAVTLNASLIQRLRAGDRPRIDFEHSNATSAGYICAFQWQPDVGVVAHIEWTHLGRGAVAAGLYNFFSPTFAAHPDTRKVLGLADGREAGSLCNCPALQAMAPVLISAESSLVRLLRKSFIAAGHSDVAALRASQAISAGRPAVEVAETIKELTARKSDFAVLLQATLIEQGYLVEHADLIAQAYDAKKSNETVSALMDALRPKKAA